MDADRIRHGIRAIDDHTLVAELVDRRLVLDICPTSNVCTKKVANLDEHPLPRLIGAGVLCSVSTDDPAMFDTDLGQEYDVLSTMGVDHAGVYDAGVQGALCDDATKQHLTAIGQAARFAAEGDASSDC